MYAAIDSSYCSKLITLTVLHSYQAVRARSWWLIPTVVIAGVGEIVGWAARIKSSYDPLARMPFIIQLRRLLRCCSSKHLLTGRTGRVFSCWHPRHSWPRFSLVSDGYRSTWERNIAG